MNPHHFLTVYTWDLLTVNANRMKQLVNTIRRCLNHIFLLEQLKSYRCDKSLRQRRWHGPTTWKGMLKNALRDIVNWQTKNYTKSQVFAWMIINSSRKNSNQWEDYHKYAHNFVLKCQYLARFGRPDILWSVNKLARSVTKCSRVCDRRLARLMSWVYSKTQVLLGP